MDILDLRTYTRISGQGCWDRMVGGTPGRQFYRKAHLGILSPPADAPSYRDPLTTSARTTPPQAMEKMQQKLGDNSNSNHGRLINGQTPSG